MKASLWGLQRARECCAPPMDWTFGFGESVRLNRFRKLASGVDFTGAPIKVLKQIPPLRCGMTNKKTGNGKNNR